jgi:hypothetical protein
MKKSAIIIITALALVATGVHADVLKVGDTGHLVGAEQLPTPVGKTSEALKQFLKCANASDPEGAADLLMSEQLMLVEPGTAVRILGYGGWLDGQYEIRILEGEYYGMSGFTFNRCVTQ